MADGDGQGGDEVDFTGDDDQNEATNGGVGRPLGPYLGVDPLHYCLAVYITLFFFVLYLMLPRGFRVHHFASHPKRYLWSARSAVIIGPTSSYSQYRGEMGPTPPSPTPHGNSSVGGSLNSGYYTHGNGGGTASSTTTSTVWPGARRSFSPYGMAGQPNWSPTSQGMHRRRPVGGSDSSTQNDDALSFERRIHPRHSIVPYHGATTPSPLAPALIPPASLPSRRNDPSDNDNEEVLVSAAMQMLRNPGLLVVAHGSRGKPKRVRLQMTDVAITWRTETIKKNAASPKRGKLHQVPLFNIMFVEVGKSTSALKRPENATVPEELCFSLLTKEGSLDLEASSSKERDALVSCFSMVLDEIHSSNWRDIQRGSSSDNASGFGAEGRGGSPDGETSMAVLPEERTSPAEPPEQRDLSSSPMEP